MKAAVATRMMPIPIRRFGLLKTPTLSLPFELLDGSDVKLTNVDEVARNRGSRSHDRAD